MTYLRNLAAAGGDFMRAALAPLMGRPPMERGVRLPADQALLRMYRQFAFSTEIRDKIIAIREMEERDGRVRKIHGRVCRDTVRGGLVMQFPDTGSTTLRKEWEGFTRRLMLNRAPKLYSDARGLVAEGNLALQMVLSPDQKQIDAAVRMPAETIIPMVDDSGRFADVTKAYEQRSTVTGEVHTTFAAWQLQLARYDPINFDDLGAMGRPFLSSAVEKWRMLVMTEEDLVIRRRQRAPLRLSHVLEGADEQGLETYRRQVEGEKGEITTDFYANKKGGVTAVQGDANLDHIADVVHLLDSFFAGSGLPKGLAGFTDGLARDVLQDLKTDYFEEVDFIQDSLAGEYEMAFRLQLLFKGIVAGPDEFLLRMATRRTETPNQVADLGLKLLGVGLPEPMVWEEMGYDPAKVIEAREAWAAEADPYPPTTGAAAPTVKVTPGNAPKGESATNVGVPGSNRGKGRG
jgi:hypothetical protein